ncbi:MAG: hypothetical protein WKF47_06240 [Geodermatophilaceae bacterium]
MRRWWIPLLTICLGIFVQAWLVYQTPLSFLSTSKMMLAGKMNIRQTAVYSEDSMNFYGTQIQLMQSSEVRRSAEALVRATHPEMQPVLVEVAVTQKPRTSIFDLQGVGSVAGVHQAYLNAVMQKYLDFKKACVRPRPRSYDWHDRAADPGGEGLAHGRGRDARLPEAKQHWLHPGRGETAPRPTSFASISNTRSSRPNSSCSRNSTSTRISIAVKCRSRTPAPRLRPQIPPNQVGMPFSDVGPEGDYLKAKQAVQLLKAERDTLSKDLRPRHPKILKLNDDISKQENLIKLFRADAVEKLETRRNPRSGSRWRICSRT